MTKLHLFNYAAIVFASVMSGCSSVPPFDVPYDKAGAPTVYSVISRIECELRDLVRDDGDVFPKYPHRDFLMDNDYDVEAALSLEVNDTGGLAPTLSYIEPFKTPMTSFALGTTATLSESRDQNFTENLKYSVRNIYDEWKSAQAIIGYSSFHYDCPTADTNLSGDLGLRSFVDLAALSPGLLEDQAGGGAQASGGAQAKGAATGSQPKDAAKGNQAPSVPNGVFGGSITFLITKGVSAAGPTWTLTRFKGNCSRPCAR
jgi:hypothetical protein